MLTVRRPSSRGNVYTGMCVCVCVHFDFQNAVTIKTCVTELPNDAIISQADVTVIL